MPRYGFLVETYRTERLKTLDVWAQIPDDRLRWRAEPRARTRGVHMFSGSIPPVVLGGLVALVALAVPTWKFGHQFLLQFFISPVQFFIIPLWLLAYVSVRRGVMPMRSGPPLRRDENPASFQRNVRYYVLMGAAMFAFNLWISWQVMSRHR